MLRRRFCFRGKFGVLCCRGQVCHASLCLRITRVPFEDRKASDLQFQLETHRRTAPFSEGVGRKEGDRDYPRSVAAPACWLSHQGVTWEGVWISPRDSDEFNVISLSDSVWFSDFPIFYVSLVCFLIYIYQGWRSWIRSDRWKILNSVWGLTVMGVFAEIRNGFDYFCKCNIFFF